MSTRAGQWFAWNTQGRTMFEEFFYQRLVQLRQSKGVSAREMSLSIGQSPGYINAIENETCFPSMQAFFYICEYLDITPCRQSVQKPGKESET